MSTDKATATTRERIWVTKFDHTVDPPRPVEEVFIENGRVVSVTTSTGTADAPR